MSKINFQKDSSKLEERRSFFKKALTILGGLTLFSPISKTSASDLQLPKSIRKSNSHKIVKSSGVNSTIGDIKLFAGNFAPKNWMLCNGQTLSISAYQALFSVLGTMYGGNGVTTFALPDLRGYIPIGTGTSSAGTYYAQGVKGGSPTTTLTVSQLPYHTHFLYGNSGSGNTNYPSGNYLAKATSMQTYASTGGNLMNTSSIGTTGSGSSINNMPPYLVLNYIICIFGIYPSRD